MNKFSAISAALSKKIIASSSIRFSLFIAGAVGVYFMRDNWQLIVAIAVVVFAGFLWLVSRHENLKRAKEFQESLVAQNKLEIAVGNRDFSGLATGASYIDSTHEYSNDIDLFGERSFFQYLNRTATQEGSDALAQKLTSNDTLHIPAKQNGIQELAQKIAFRQDFTATATLLQHDTKPATVNKWLTTYERFVPQVFNWTPWVLISLSLVAIGLYAFSLVPGYVVGVLFGIGLLVSGNYVKKINAFSAQISQLERFFNQYSKLILLIENETFQSDLLKELKASIATKDQPASARFKELAQAIGRLDQRNNMLFGFLANGFGLWDLKQVHTIETWLQYNAPYVKTWLDTVAQVDAYNSMGNYAFNHSHFVFPTIGDTAFHMHAVDTKHPLLDPTKAIGNDITIDSGAFFIITGANMAGKSTFLRTVAMNIVCANAGLPIWASTMTYNPIKLITSMRTSDSLTDEASYFFSELSRLKYIVDKIEQDRYFIVLDEILKGTNSQDKANGSRKLIEKLSRKHATGIIATHDLSLTEVANEYDSISNYFFDAEIVNDELFFDYTFKNGVATNMNASFLLRKMGIVDV